MWKEQTEKENRDSGKHRISSSVLPQWYCLLINALLSDNTHPKGVTGVDVSFCRRDEDIFDQLNCLVLSQRNMLHPLHVLETNLG